MKRIPYLVLLFACNPPVQEEDSGWGLEDHSMSAQGVHDDDGTDFEEYEEYEEEWSEREAFEEELYFFEEIENLDVQSALMESLRAERIQVYSLAWFPDKLISDIHEVSILEEGTTSMYEDDIIEHMLTASDDYDVFYLPLRASRIQEPLWENIALVTQAGLFCYDVEGALLAP